MATDGLVLVKKAKPNGWRIEILRDSKYGGYLVQEYEDDYDNDPVEFDTLEQATSYFNERVKELAQTPNCAMQERYDEEHGTVNGYPEWNYLRREY